MASLRLSVKALNTKRLKCREVCGQPCTKDMSIKMVNMKELEYILSDLIGRNKQNGMTVNYMGASRFLDH